MEILRKSQSHLLAGSASVVAGLSFLVGLVVYFSVFVSASYGDMTHDVLTQLNLMSSHSTLMYVWYFVIYIVFGVALIALQVGIKPYLEAGVLSSIALIFGYLWSGLTITCGMLANVGTYMILQLMPHQQDIAISLWYTLQMLLNGIGGGNELVGGVWLAMLGLSLANDCTINRWLKWVAVIFGCFGVLTSVPMLTELGGVFGLGSMIWFLVMGRYQLDLYKKVKTYE